MKRTQVNIDPKTAVAMKAALDDIRGVMLKYDSRIMGLVMLDRASIVYGHLKTLGHETPESVAEMFNNARDRAVASLKMPTVALGQQNEDGTVNLTQGSERAS